MSDYDPTIKNVLPHERIYTLQIGNETFQVSGASLSSDSPSYFTNFFLQERNKDKVLIIDRSNEIFRLILQHLQGYHLEIGNADIYTRLFNDALYYNLPNLLKSLTINNDYYYTIIESEYFKIPKKLINDPATGNFPNFFSVSNDALYKDMSVLMLNKNWIRPPPQAAPSLARSISLLRDLLSMLENIDIEIKSKEHRASLIKEAKYYRFNGLIQKLIDHRIIFNPFIKKEEIIINLAHIDHKNISFEDINGYLELSYQRPYGIDSISRPLYFQIESKNDIEIDFQNGVLVVEGEVLKKLTKLLKPLIQKIRPSPSFNPNNELQFQLIENETTLLTSENEKLNINDLKGSNTSGKKRKLKNGETSEESSSQSTWIIQQGILQFFYNNDSNEFNVKLIKAKVYPKEITSFFSNLDFL